MLWIAAVMYAASSLFVDMKTIQSECSRSWSMIQFPQLALSGLPVSWIKRAYVHFDEHFHPTSPDTRKCILAVDTALSDLIKQAELIFSEEAAAAVYHQRPFDMLICFWLSKMPGRFCLYLRNMSNIHKPVCLIVLFTSYLYVSNFIGSFLLKWSLCGIFPFTPLLQCLVVLLVSFLCKPHLITPTRPFDFITKEELSDLLAGSRIAWGWIGGVRISL